MGNIVQSTWYSCPLPDSFNYPKAKFHRCWKFEINQKTLGSVNRSISEAQSLCSFKTEMGRFLDFWENKGNGDHTGLWCWGRLVMILNGCAASRGRWQIPLSVFFYFYLVLAESKTPFKLPSLARVESFKSQLSQNIAIWFALL